MSLLIVPEKKVIQTDVVGVDYSNPITRGIAFISLLSNDKRDLVSGQTPTQTGTVTLDSNKLGRFTKYSSSYLDYPKLPKGLARTTPVTIFWIQEPRSAGSYSTILELNVSPGDQSFLIYQSSSDNSYYFVAGPRGAGVPLWGGVGAQTNNKVDVFCLTSANGIGSTTLGDWNLYRNGNIQPQTGSSPLSGNTGAIFRVGARDGGADAYSGLIGQLLIFKRVLSSVEVKSLSTNPWQIFEPDAVPFYFNSAASGSLTGDNSNQANTSSAASIAQTHVTLGANSSQANSSSAASVSQTHVIAGAAADQQNASSTAAIITAGVLTGANSDQANNSSTADISQTHVTIGANSSQANASSVAAIIADGTIVLTGANSSQSNASAAASVAQTHVLIGAASQQVNQSTVAGLITGHESDLILPGFLVMAPARYYQSRAARHHAAIAQKRNYKIIV